MSAIVLEEIRGGLLDTLRRGDIAVVDQNGLRFSLGDPYKRAYYRSAVKPIQVLPFLALGLADRYQFTEEEIALTAASHLGQANQVAVILEMLRKTGLTEEEMVMGASYPQDRKEASALRAIGEPKRRRYHNCSGKHTAMLAIARALGEPLSQYRYAESKTGQLTLDYLELFTDIPREEIGIGVDGCGVPIFAVPLTAMATSFLRFVHPELLKDQEIAKAANRMVAAYHHAPYMVRGRNTLCEVLNSDTNLFGKLGANGVYCLGLKKEGLGIAVKIEDGDVHCLPMVIKQILLQLNYDNQQTLHALSQLIETKVYNDAKEEVGYFACDFVLEKR